MAAEVNNESREPMDGDWCLVDLSDEITEEATKVAHALGMDFHAFMRVALEEKLARLRGGEELGRSLSEVRWTPLLKSQS
jgi:hypothetical protein